MAAPITDLIELRKFSAVLETRSCLTHYQFAAHRRQCCSSASVLLIGKSAAALRGLQVAQNCAARVSTGFGIHDHITAALRELHWLPVHQRIEHKVLTVYGVQGPLL